MWATMVEVLYALLLYTLNEYADLGLARWWNPICCFANIYACIRRLSVDQLILLSDTCGIYKEISMLFLELSNANSPEFIKNLVVDSCYKFTDNSLFDFSRNVDKVYTISNNENLLFFHRLFLCEINLIHSMSVSRA